FGDALWWATTTITTVGYGEHHPVTPSGRVVAACLMFSGIALFSVVTGSVASWILDRVREEDGEVAADDRMRDEVEALT
ncbi:potassium channel family protein, partial [Nocardia farcinica]|uniref:potassium channel family protein n=3 Tax=Actinomycetes TaxID=1760 RepID=UPI001145A202